MKPKGNASQNTVCVQFPQLRQSDSTRPAGREAKEVTGEERDFGSVRSLGGLCDERHANSV